MVVSITTIKYIDVQVYNEYFYWQIWSVPLGMDIRVVESYDSDLLANSGSQISDVTWC